MFQELAVLAATAALGGGVLLHLLRKFTKKPCLAAVVIFPLAAFVTGFCLRLSGAERTINLGYFLTDFSFLFVYLVFALAFLLGQVKYWKK